MLIEINRYGLIYDFQPSHTIKFTNKTARHKNMQQKQTYQGAAKLPHLLSFSGSDRYINLTLKNTTP